MIDLATGAKWALTLSLTVSAATASMAAQSLPEEGREAFRAQVTSCFDNNYLGIEDRISSADVVADALTYLCSNAIGNSVSSSSQSELSKMAQKGPAIEAAKKIFTVMILRKRAEAEQRKAAR